MANSGMLTGDVLWRAFATAGEAERACTLGVRPSVIFGMGYQRSSVAEPATWLGGQAEKCRGEHRAHGGGGAQWRPSSPSSMQHDAHVLAALPHGP